MPINDKQELESIYSTIAKAIKEDDIEKARCQINELDFLSLSALSEYASKQESTVRHFCIQLVMASQSAKDIKWNVSLYTQAFCELETLISQDIFELMQRPFEETSKAQQQIVCLAIFQSGCLFELAKKNIETRAFEVVDSSGALSQRYFFLDQINHLRPEYKLQLLNTIERLLFDVLRPDDGKITAPSNLSHVLNYIPHEKGLGLLVTLASCLREDVFDTAFESMDTYLSLFDDKIKLSHILSGIEPAVIINFIDLFEAKTLSLNEYLMTQTKLSSHEKDLIKELSMCSQAEVTRHYQEQLSTTRFFLGILTGHTGRYSTSERIVEHRNHAERSIYLEKILQTEVIKVLVAQLQSYIEKNNSVRTRARRASITSISELNLNKQITLNHKASFFNHFDLPVGKGPHFDEGRRMPASEPTLLGLKYLPRSSNPSSFLAAFGQARAVQRSFIHTSTLDLLVERHKKNKAKLDGAILSESFSQIDAIAEILRVTIFVLSHSEDLTKLAVKKTAHIEFLHSSEPVFVYHNLLTDEYCAMQLTQKRQLEELLGELGVVLDPGVLNAAGETVLSLCRI